ncbi:glycoside hydrolase family 5 protein [Parasediminibacterium sp. JCM 36343]|uniref:glycoside hydrolase family 5 protein n=1 Tax=Parasediminibacterium sp. JCM 36343 TaxID=3374279 RepID=UPI003979C6E6
MDKSQIYSRNNAHLAEIIGAGVNLSLLEHTWEHAEDLLKTDMKPKLEAIRKSGFQTVRVPVAFDMFLQPNSSNLQIELIDKLGEAYNTCEKLGLHMIITYHYGKIYYGSDNRYAERDRVMWMWKQLQNKFKGMGYDKLFFELYNEPTEERNAWKEDVTYLVNGLRWEEKERYYIIGGTNYNNADELLDLGKLEDDKVLYTFHYYEPYLFTHQGAEWVKDRTALSNIPYPYDKNKMPPLMDSTIGSAVEKDYTKYPAEGTKEFMMLRVRLIAAECKKRNMPLICTETGVINQVEDQYRGNYLEDVTSIMDNLGIPTLLWDYDQRFSVVKPNGKLLKEVKQWLDSKR